MKGKPLIKEKPKAPYSLSANKEDDVEYVERTVIREECKVVLEPITHVKVKKYKEKKKFLQNDAYKSIRIDLHQNSLKTLNLTENYFQNIIENEEFAVANLNGEIDSPLNSEDDDEKSGRNPHNINEDRKIVVPITVRLTDIPKPIPPFEVSNSNVTFICKRPRLKITRPNSFQINSLYKYMIEYDPSEYEDFEVDEVYLYS